MELEIHAFSQVNGAVHVFRNNESWTSGHAHID